MVSDDTAACDPVGTLITAQVHLPSHSKEMDKLPREVWELVFDHLGISVRKVQLTCRLFRDISARRLWSDVTISIGNPFAAHSGVTIARHNIEDAYDILLPVTAYFGKVTLELLGTAPQVPYDSAIKSIRLVLKHAVQVGLIIRNRTVFTSQLGAGVLETLKSMGDKLNVQIKDTVSFGDRPPRPEVLLRTYRMIEPFAASVEANITIKDLGSPLIKEATMPVTKLTLASLPVSMEEIDNLVRSCPRLKSLSLPTYFWTTGGRLMLPENVSEVEVYENYRPIDPGHVTHPVVFNSQSVTLLRIDTGALKLAISFDFPSLRTLELTSLRDIDTATLAKLERLASGGLDRLVIEVGESKWLPLIGPIVSNVREEIQLVRLGGSALYSSDTWKSKMRYNYMADLITFVRHSHKARHMLLELVPLKSGLMEAFLKLLVYPGLESLRTTDFYRRNGELDFDQYPYMHEVLPARETRHFTSLTHQKEFEVDITYVRLSRPPDDFEGLPRDASNLIKGQR